LLTCPSCTVDPEESSSFGDADEFDFDISYLDGRRIQGFYFEETVAIGDAVIENQQLGLALESVRPTGIMGLGFSANVAALESYPTIVDNLYTQGHINSRAFSLYLVCPVLSRHEFSGVGLANSSY
jgi:hypothetical protein